MSVQPSEGCIFVVIEIPRGSRNKYEIDHEGGRVFLDRRLFPERIPSFSGWIRDCYFGRIPTRAIEGCVEHCVRYAT